ncbi:MAG TPA: GAF and ANTAR domain-containing protein [Acidimicrobiales bacterium]|nr:GAF and ANTAR domain-containing protein [Acidimicrobiales bacterium]
MPEQAGEDPSRRALDALVLYFVGDSTMDEALAKLCDAALAAVPPAVMAGISMTLDARVGTYVFTHPEVVEVDQAQYDTGDGPCIEAFRSGQVVSIGSTAAPGPFPRFQAVAAEHGLASVLSLPMVADDHAVGALNLYAHREHAFDGAAVRAGQGFATQAAFLLLNHQAYWDAVSLSENLHEAMRSRAQIEQAKGVIMGATSCSADEAFAQLRRQSQFENVKLRDIAHEIVRRTEKRSH